MLRLEIQLEKKDLRNFVLHNLFHNYSIYLLVSMFGFLIFNLLKRQFLFLEKNILISILSVILISVFLYFIFIIVTLLFSGTIKNRKFLQKKKYEFTDKKINIYYHEANYPINWKNFKKITENKSYYYFYINKAQSLIFPKRLLDRHDKHLLKKIIRKANKIIKKK